MEPIIEPISLDLIKAELTPAKKLRNTNKSNNEIYVINHHDSPNVMKEIGRLREEAFRDSGGGSGLSMDIDEFDTMENPYQQLIVWDPDAEKILGGYASVMPFYIFPKCNCPRFTTICYRPTFCKSRLRI